MTPEQLDKWRVVPRLLILLYSIFLGVVSFWFMGLENPLPSQSAFVSVIAGVAPAFFGLYVNSGPATKRE
tara:strand:- start:344 stop:553 length:210 start_codon:yes stop_codon:yes gene_type:complete